MTESNNILDILNQKINRVRVQQKGTGLKVDDRVETKAVYDTLQGLGFPTKTYLDKLEYLRLNKENIAGIDAGGYNGLTNTITYPSDEILYHELFHCASSKNNSKATGITRYEIAFDDDEKEEKRFVGMDEGITDMFAIMTKPDLPCGYPFEKLCAETLRDLFGVKVFNGYFNNSYEEFIRAFPDDVEISIIDLITDLDEYNKNSYRIFGNDYSNKKLSKEQIKDLKIEVTYLVEYIIEHLINIGQAVGKDKNTMLEYITNKINDPIFLYAKSFINYDKALENVSSMGLK